MKDDYKLNIADIDDIAYRTGLAYEEVERVLEAFIRKLKRRGYVIRKCGGFEK